MTREELREKLWPGETVDFDSGLNKAVKKIREALDDSVGNPRFVETLPRRGYRFIGSVIEPAAAQQPDFVPAASALPMAHQSAAVASDLPASIAPEEVFVPPAAVPPSAKPRQRRLRVFVGAFAGMVFLLVVGFVLVHHDQIWSALETNEPGITEPSTMMSM